MTGTTASGFCCRFIFIVGLSILDVGTEGVPHIGDPVKQCLIGDTLQQFPSDSSAPSTPQPIKQEALQPAPSTHLHGSTGVGIASPSSQAFASGPQYQAPTCATYSGYEASAANPAQQSPAPIPMGNSKQAGTLVARRLLTV